MDILQILTIIIAVAAAFLAITVEKRVNQATLHYDAVPELAPTIAHREDAAVDLRAAENTVILPGGLAKISTGVAVALPPGYAGVIKGRSGLASKNGLNPLGGLIDNGYRGTIYVTIHNTGNQKYTVTTGDRIAQMMLVAYPTIHLKASQINTNTTRGTNGHGSTGKA